MGEATELIAVAEQFVQLICEYILAPGISRECSTPDNSTE